MKIVLAGTLALSLGGCAEVISHSSALPGQSQTVTYAGGAEYLHSRGAEASLVANLTAAGDRLKVQLAISNTSDHPIVFSETGVAATENGTALHLVTADQQAHEASTRDTWRKIAAGLAAGANGYNAAQAGRTNVSGDVSVTNQYGQTAHGTYTATAYDPAVQQAAMRDAQAQNAQIVANVHAQHASELRAIGGELQKTTIYPGQTIEGSLTLQTPSKTGASNNIDVEVTLGQETHALHFVENKHS